MLQGPYWVSSYRSAVTLITTQQQYTQSHKLQDRLGPEADEHTFNQMKQYEQSQRRDGITTPVQQTKSEKALI